MTIFARVVRTEKAEVQWLELRLDKEARQDFLWLLRRGLNCMPNEKKDLLDLADRLEELEA